MQMNVQFNPVLLNIFLLTSIVNGDYGYELLVNKETSKTIVVCEDNELIAKLNISRPKNHTNEDPRFHFQGPSNCLYTGQSKKSDYIFVAVDICYKETSDLQSMYGVIILGSNGNPDQITKNHCNVLTEFPNPDNMNQLSNLDKSNIERQASGHTDSKTCATMMRHSDRVEAGLEPEYQTESRQGFNHPSNYGNIYIPVGLFYDEYYLKRLNRLTNHSELARNSLIAFAKQVADTYQHEIFQSLANITIIYTVVEMDKTFDITLHNANTILDLWKPFSKRPSGRFHVAMLLTP